MSENILDIARRVRELVEAATPGPWAAFDATRGDPADGPTQFDIRNENELVAVVPDYSKGGYDDAAFIAKTRTAAPQLAGFALEAIGFMRFCAGTQQVGDPDPQPWAAMLLERHGIPITEAGE